MDDFQYLYRVLLDYTHACTQVFFHNGQLESRISDQREQTGWQTESQAEARL